MKQASLVAIALVLFAPSISGQQPSEPLPASTLPLRLVGVARDSATPARSAGLIQCGHPEEKRAARLVAVGDQACDVAEVTEVREKAVVIRNLLTHRLELLTLPASGRLSASPALATNESPVERRPDEIPAPYVQPLSPDVVTIELSKELLNRYMSNLPEVLSSAVATPHYASASGGQATIDGYEMSRVRAGGIVDQLGVKDGDVLLEFNGQKLDSLTAVTGVLAQAQALSGARMTVLRNGRRMTFVFSVK